MWTPWGTAQYIQKAVVKNRQGQGVTLTLVSTASHGGIRLGKRDAKKVSPELLRLVAHNREDGHWFEEDCAYAALFVDLGETALVPAFFGNNPAEGLMNDLEKVTCTYYPKYAIAKGLPKEGMTVYHRDCPSISYLSEYQCTDSTWVCSKCGEGLAE
jgi:hypothetical protein